MGNLPIVKQLMDKNANIIAADNNGWTPIDYGKKNMKYN
jgi:hypothetical protein